MHRRNNLEKAQLHPSRKNLPSHPGEENRPPFGKLGTDKQLRSTSPLTTKSGKLITSCGTTTSGST